MRLRARQWHALEGFLDNILGYAINVVLVILVYNQIFSHSIELHQNLLGGIIFFFVAWGRKYVMRRTFSGIIKRQYEREEQEQQHAAYIGLRREGPHDDR